MKIIYYIILILTMSFSFANYELVYPMQSYNIKFVKKEIDNGNPELPIIYGDWTNINEPFNCTEWIPSRNTVTNGVNFQQTKNCSQEQIRTVTNGQVTEEYQTIAVVVNQNNTGNLECRSFNVGINGFASYGSQSNLTGIIENPNKGSRISWGSVLIFSDLNQINKANRNEITVSGYVYSKQSVINIRNINFEGFNYKSYDAGVCRYPI